MKVNSAIEKYRLYLKIERNLAKNTISAYITDLFLLQNYLEKNKIVDINDINEKILENFIIFINEENINEKKRSKASISRIIISLRGFFKYAYQEKINSTDLSINIIPPSLNQKIPHALTVKEINDFISKASKNNSTNPLAIRDKFLLELLYSSGGRISEIVNLDLNDFDEKELLIKITGKGNKQRIVPIGELAVKYYFEYLEKSRKYLTKKPSNALFLNKNGNRLSRFSAWHIIQNIFEISDVNFKVSPHVFRHSYATHLLDAGVDIRIVQELLGHSSVTTTQIYTKVSVSTLQNVYKKSHPRA